MVLSRLQGDDDKGILQAIDELYVHHLLSGSCDSRYEEDEGSPDFRLYRSAEYVAGIEVLTLFAEQGFDSEVTRNITLVDEINRRVRPTNWHASIEVIDWSRQPRVTDIANWLESTIQSLPEPQANLASGDYPTATYSRSGIKLEFTFIPRLRATEPSETEPIMFAGPATGRRINPAKRLRNVLSQKGGSKYDHRCRPFAIAVCIREPSCDIEEIVNALYGDDIIIVEIDNPGSYRADRRRNGTFSISTRFPEGRNRRLSCVFVLMRAWEPGSSEWPTVLRFDNPCAEHEFPDDLLVPNRQLVARRDDSGVRMEWQPPVAR